MSSRVVTVKDDVARVFASINELIGKQVLVGIPEKTAGRDEDEDEGPINNARLGYIHEFGSPRANIPARPFLIPGVEKAKDNVLVPLKKAAELTMAADSKGADQALQVVGLIAQASARNEISTAAFVPLKPETIANRFRSRDTKSMRKGEIKYLELVDGGMSPGDAQAVTGIKALINTGQLRNSITFVVRRRK